MFTRRQVLISGLASVCPIRGVSQQLDNSPMFGRRLITGFRGQQVDDPEVQTVLGFLDRREIAGVLLLQRNIASPEQLLTLTEAFRSAANGYVPIIAVDQEGGKVARLGARNGFFEWDSAADIAASGMSDSEILEYYSVRAAQLAFTGINLTFGPVIDLNVNPSNPIIGALGRSFGRDVQDVVRLADLFIQAHRSASIKTCLKHFPGHGSSTSDSHLGLVDVSDTWNEEELLPYTQLVERGSADAVMTAHVIVAALSNGEKVPFSLYGGMSAELERTAKFEGSIFSDDMQMGAIVDHFGISTAARDAVNAGNTFLVYSNYRPENPINTVENVRLGLEVEYALGSFNKHLLQVASNNAEEFLLGLV